MTDSEIVIPLFTDEMAESILRELDDGMAEFES